MISLKTRNGRKLIAVNTTPKNMHSGSDLGALIVLHLSDPHRVVSHVRVYRNLAYFNGCIVPIKRFSSHKGLLRNPKTLEAPTLEVCALRSKSECSLEGFIFFVHDSIVKNGVRCLGVDGSNLADRKKLLTVNSS
jgi:hypothetical protein